jgi:predicted nucleic acid-binding Zn ribbon protein
VQTEAPPTPPAAAPQASCPGCGKPVDRGDSFCLDCGRRIGHEYRRPPNWRIPVVLTALLVIALGIAAGFGVTQLTNKEEGPETITVGTGPGGATEADPGETPTAAAPTPAPAQPQPGQPAPAPAQPAEPQQPSGPATWPEGEEAYTVVLLTTKSKDTADDTAQKAIDAGLSAGVFKSDEFARFEPGLYVVFAGQYDNVEAASDKAQQLSDDNPGAYARFVEPK